MIEGLRATSLGFKGVQSVSPREAYNNLLQENDEKAQQATSSVERPTPPDGIGKKLDVIA